MTFEEKFTIRMKLAELLNLKDVRVKPGEYGGNQKVTYRPTPTRVAVFDPDSGDADFGWVVEAAMERAAKNGVTTVTVCTSRDSILALCAHILQSFPERGECT